MQQRESLPVEGEEFIAVLPCDNCMSSCRMSWMERQWNFQELQKAENLVKTCEIEVGFNRILWSYTRRLRLFKLSVKRDEEAMAKCLKCQENRRVEMKKC